MMSIWNINTTHSIILRIQCHWSLNSWSC